MAIIVQMCLTLYGLCSICRGMIQIRLVADVGISYLYDCQSNIAALRASIVAQKKKKKNPNAPLMIKVTNTHTDTKLPKLGQRSFGLNKVNIVLVLHVWWLLFGTGKGTKLHSNVSPRQRDLLLSVIGVSLERLKRRH